MVVICVINDFDKDIFGGFTGVLLFFSDIYLVWILAVLVLHSYF